jgi:hypothetical protein
MFLNSLIKIQTQCRFSVIMPRVSVGNFIVYSEHYVFFLLYKRTSRKLKVD